MRIRCPICGEIIDIDSSKIKTRSISLSKFTLDEVVGCKRLDHPYTGLCAYCNGESVTLTHLVITRTNRFFVCEECGRKITRRLFSED